MPNKYTRKTSRASYSKENLRIAVEKVKQNELSNYAASKIYGIPKSTLNDRVRKKTGLKSETLGRPPAIPIEIEANLASCLRTLEKWGWGLSKTEVIEMVTEFVRKNRLKTPFKDGVPGHDWFKAFRKRHNLSIKKPQPIEYLRKKMTDPFVIYEYFEQLAKVYKELNLNDPNNIWNLDETSVCLDPTKTKVVGAVGKPCTRTTAGTGKENITVLTTVNAAEKKLTPLIVYKGKYVYDEWMAERREDFDFDISYAASKRGWMETEIFYNYLSKIVIPAMGTKRPILLIYDGHVTHVDMKVIELAIEKNITILKLPPHTSHLLQPLDLAVFKSLKVNWDKKLVQHQRQNIGAKMRKKDFAALFAETWHQTSPTVIQNGFKKGGIYPFNENAVPVQKFDPAALERWKNHKSKASLKEMKSLKLLCIDIINNVKSASTSVTMHKCVNDGKLENHTQEASNVSFEEILLKKLTYHPQNTGKVTKKRVAQGAEVITRTFLDKKEKESKGTLTQKSQKQKSKINSNPNSSSHVSDFEIPGPSNVVKQNTTHITQKNKTVIPSRKGKGVGKRSQQIKTDNTEKDQQGGYVLLQKLNTEHELDSKSETSMNILQETGFMRRENSQKVSHTHAALMDIFDEETECMQSEKDELKVESQAGLKIILDEATGLIRSMTINASMVEGEILSKPSTECTRSVKENKENLCDNINYKQTNTKESIKPNMKRKRMTKKQTKPPKPKQQRRSSKSSTTSEEVVMSVHSDSDINDIISIESDEEDTMKTKIARKEAEIFAEIALLDEIEKVKVNDVITYNLGDTVMARYYSKKKWMYYVGVVIDIKSNENEKKYGISYYKTIRRNNNLKFIKSKRSDEDYIPFDLIVKQIDLIQISENPDEYVLNDDEDIVYFL